LGWIPKHVERSK